MTLARGSMLRVIERLLRPLIMNLTNVHVLWTLVNFYRWFCVGVDVDSLV